ncbi:MAG: YihY/virulence factor BrkB family protein [Bacteroidales bacterium]|nr:YihY/virulence factor BrkB family protein [Bacteroidales bacterium]
MGVRNNVKRYYACISAKISGLISSRPFRIFLFRLKHLVIPGFDRTPIYDVLRFFFKGLAKGVLNQRASAISYNFFMALFPFIFFLFTVLAYLPYQEFVPMVRMFILDFLPEQSQEFVFSTLDGLLTKNGTLLTTSSLFVLYFASQGIISMIMAFNTSYHHMETRNGFALRVTAVVLLVLIILIVIGMLFALLGIGRLMRYLATQGFHALWLFVIVKWLSVFFLVFVIISLIYYFAPASRKGYHFFSQGSFLTTVLITLASWGFNEYIAHFSRYNAIFGSIGAIIILLLFIQFLSTFIIIGFELNISIHNARMKGISLLEAQEDIG